MKVETPQILWNASEEESTNYRKKGKGGLNAALYSIDLLASGLPEPHNHVMVTAGNSSQLNLWSVCIEPCDQAKPNHSIFQRKATTLAPGASKSSGLTFLCSLGRDHPAVNCVKFSPDGLHLAVGSDGANLQLFSVPWHKRGNGNGHHYWSTLTQDSCELTYRVVNTGEGITDLSWSKDGKRLLVASLDHSVCLVQNLGSSGNDEWTVAYRSSEHLHYVQGVSYDPKGVYLTSMSNDRSIRIYPRKANAKTLKKVIKQKKQQHAAEQEAEQEKKKASPLQATTKNNSESTTLSPDEAIQDWLNNTKFEVSKTRLIKYAPKTHPDMPRHGWFADESTLESFFRRLEWTVDGNFLICPAALHRSEGAQQHQHAVLVFARHNFDEPHKILTGFQKPAVAVRPNPVLFELPATDKENTDEKKVRNIFCVLTWDSIVIYDTHHKEPLALISGLHYANLTDAAWTADGHSLVVSSSDGYVTLVRFARGELGVPREVEKSPENCPLVQSTAAALNKVLRVDDSKPPIVPPTEPGPMELADSRPSKKAKVNFAESSLPQKRDTKEPNLLVPKKKKRIQPVLMAVSK